MSNVGDLLTTTNVRCHASAASRKRALQVASELIAAESMNADALFDGLMARERLGSTGLGDGVAIPHCRLNCAQMRAALISLPAPIDYEAVDGQPVDLLFVLVVPEEEQQAHLTALSELAEVFSNPAARAALRAAASDDELRSTMQSALNHQEPSSRTA